MKRTSGKDKLKKRQLPVLVGVDEQQQKKLFSLFHLSFPSSKIAVMVVSSLAGFLLNRTIHAKNLTND